MDSTATSSTPTSPTAYVSQAASSPLFEPPAVEALSHSARGMPRLINRIAHYALTAAALGNARTVTAEHLEHAVAELRL